MIRRALMTADAVGGVWDYALDLAGGLAARGVGVTLAVMGPVPSPDRQAAARRAGVALRHAPFRLEWMEGADADLHAAGNWLLSLEREAAPDVVHVNGYAHAVLPFRAPTLCVAHSCVRSWWRAVHGTDAPPAWNAYTARVAEGLRHARLVVAPTRAMLDAVSDLYGLPAVAAVIPNGRGGACLRPGPKRPYVLGAGRVWDAGKNMAALDAAAPDLPWPAFIAGDTAGPDGRGAPLRRACALGPLPSHRLARWMACASVFVHPARYEPFGLAPLEAARAGCALVLGDIPSLREVWSGAALFVDPDDTPALARAIRRLIDDAPLRRRLAYAAHRRADAYGVAPMVRRYMDAYASVAG